MPNVKDSSIALDGKITFELDDGTTKIVDLANIGTATTAPPASTTVAGIVTLADTTAVTTGDATKVVTAAQLKAVKDNAAGAAVVTTVVSGSRSITAEDNGDILDCRATPGVTLTIPAGLSPQPSFILLCHIGGTAIAFGTGVKNNGNSSPVPVSSTDSISVIPTATQNDYKVSKSGSTGLAAPVAKSDLASDVQTSLGKADTAIQSVPVTSVAGKTGAVSLLNTDVSGLSAVASSGNYSDLSGKPDLTTKVDKISALSPRTVVIPTGVAWLNTSNNTRIVNISGGTVSSVYIATALNPTVYSPQGTSSGNFTLLPGEQIKIDWSVQPTVTIS